ncbi:unnamed protein product [Chrysoparadoxa australica]
MLMVGLEGWVRYVLLATPHSFARQPVNSVCTFAMMYFMFQLLSFLWAFIVLSYANLAMDFVERFFITTSVGGGPSLNTLSAAFGTFCCSYYTLRVFSKFGTSLAAISWDSKDDFPRISKEMATIFNYMPSSIALVFIPQMLCVTVLLFGAGVCHPLLVDQSTLVGYSWDNLSSAWAELGPIQTGRLLLCIVANSEQHHTIWRCIRLIFRLALLVYVQLLLYVYPNWSAVLCHRGRGRSAAITLGLICCSVVTISTWTAQAAGGILGMPIWNEARICLLPIWCWSTFLLVVASILARDSPPSITRHRMSRCFADIRALTCLALAQLLIRGIFNPSVGLLKASEEFTLVTFLLPITYVFIYHAAHIFTRLTAGLVILGPPVAVFGAVVLRRMSTFGGPGTAMIMAVHLYSKLLKFFGSIESTRMWKAAQREAEAEAKAEEDERDIILQMARENIEMRGRRQSSNVSQASSTKYNVYKMDDVLDPDAGDSLAPSPSRKLGVIFSSQPWDAPMTPGSAGARLEGEGNRADLGWGGRGKRRRRSGKRSRGGVLWADNEGKHVSMATPKAEKAETEEAEREERLASPPLSPDKPLRARFESSHCILFEAPPVGGHNSTDQAGQPRIPTSWYLLVGLMRLAVWICVVFLFFMGALQVLNLMQHENKFFPRMISFRNTDKAELVIDHAFVATAVLSTQTKPAPRAPPEYATCGSEWHGFSLLDFALFSELVYFEPHEHAVLLKQMFPKIWPKLRLMSSDAMHLTRGVPPFLDIYDEKAEVSVVAIRGSDPGRVNDFIEDIKMWTEPVVLHAILGNLFPTIRFWPDSLTAVVIARLHDALFFFGLWSEAQYWQPLLQYVKEVVLPREGHVIITGHSLGGGLARIVASAAQVPCITFSPPGIAQSYLKFRVGDDGVDSAFFHHKSIAVTPEMDFVTKVDTQTGMVQNIQCSTAHQSAQFSCHMLESTVCELINRCGDSRERFTACR